MFGPGRNASFIPARPYGKMREKAGAIALRRPAFLISAESVAEFNTPLVWWISLPGNHVVAQRVVAYHNALVGLHPSLLGDACAAVAFGQAGFDRHLPRLRNADSVQGIAGYFAVANRNACPKPTATPQPNMQSQSREPLMLTLET